MGIGRRLLKRMGRAGHMDPSCSMITDQIMCAKCARARCLWRTQKCGAPLALVVLEYGVHACAGGKRAEHGAAMPSPVYRTVPMLAAEVLSAHTSQLLACC